MTSLLQFISKSFKSVLTNTISYFYSKCQRACEKLDLDASIDTPIMAFFWPTRKTGEPADTIEDPYEKNVQKPKRPRKESTTSTDDSEAPCRKQFGYIPGSSSESSSSESEEEQTRKIEEVPAESVNAEEDEYEVK